MYIPPHPLKRHPYKLGIPFAVCLFAAATIIKHEGWQHGRRQKLWFICLHHFLLFEVRVAVPVCKHNGLDLLQDTISQSKNLKIQLELKFSLLSEPLK